jgi:hypothetical protein
MTRKGGAGPAGEEECVRPWSGFWGAGPPHTDLGAGPLKSHHQTKLMTCMGVP